MALDQNEWGEGTEVKRRQKCEETPKTVRAVILKETPKTVRSRYSQIPKFHSQFFRTKFFELILLAELNKHNYAFAHADAPYWGCSTQITHAYTVLSHYLALIPVI
jgi:hypothetical protein